MINYHKIVRLAIYCSRMRGDMIQMYKIIHGIDDLDWKDFFVKTETDRTRYSEHKFYVKYSRSKEKERF